MRYIKQILIILLFCFLGEALAKWLPLPIPAAIYGLLLMLLALSTGILKVRSISDTAYFLIDVMPILFVAPTANLIRYWGECAPSIVPACVIVLVSTVLVFGVSGLVTKFVSKKRGGTDG